MPLKLYKRNGFFYVRGTVRGRRCREACGTTDRKLAETYRATREAELYEAALFGERAVVSYQRAALSYLEDGEEPRSDATKFYVGRLVKHFGPSRLLSDIAGPNAQSHLDNAVRAIVGDDAAPATKNRGVITPHTSILNHAARRKWCDHPKFERKTEPKVKVVWLTPAQALKLEAAAAPHLKALIRFLVCTGARLSEVLDLAWEDVDLAAAQVVFRGTKAEAQSEDAKPRVARLPPAAVTALANLPGANQREGKVFRRDDGEPYTDQERQRGGQIRTAWAKACRDAGLPGRMRKVKVRCAWTPRTDRKGARYAGLAGARQTKIIEVEKFVPDVTPHNLRHTWASWAYALCKDLLLLKDEGGWYTTRMVERYSHLVPVELVPEIATVWGPSHPRFGVIPTAPASGTPATHGTAAVPLRA